jgi:glycosyltransferase involved in cell wall biosynthesis
MQLVVSHPTGNKNVRSIIESLHAEGMLKEFNTTLAPNPDSLVFNLLPKQLQSEFKRRAFNIPQNRVHTYPWYEILRMLLPRIGLSRYTKHENSFAGIDAVYKKLDIETAKRLKHLHGKTPIMGVYAYEDGALETFRAAKELGLKCIYDLPIAYWDYGRNLMKAEAERLPQWACTLGGGINDSQEKLDRKFEEMAMADMIIAPGEFVIRSLPNWTKNKMIHVAPFGSPITGAVDSSQYKSENKIRPLRVLFAGSMGQRKGLGDLFAAMKILNTKQIELIVMGSLLAPMEFYRQQFEDFTYEPGRPHEEVLALMKSCDIFCLPSIVEGRALVMQEAMSQGLPLIITPNTGGEDLILEGKTGFLVPISSPQAIAEKLNWFLENRRAIPYMAKFAQKHAAKYTWAAYGNGVANAIKSNFKQHTSILQ